MTEKERKATLNLIKEEEEIALKVIQDLQAEVAILKEKIKHLEWENKCLKEE